MTINKIDKGIIKTHLNWHDFRNKLITAINTKYLVDEFGNEVIIEICTIDGTPIFSCMASNLKAIRSTKGINITIKAPNLTECDIDLTSEIIEHTFREERNGSEFCKCASDYEIVYTAQCTNDILYRFFL